MYIFLYRFGTWLLSKLGAAVLIVVLALVGVGVWLYLNDQVDAETRRLEYMEGLRQAQTEFTAQKATVLAELQDLRTTAASQEERIERAQKIVAGLMEMRSWWEEWFGDGEQQAANETQIARMGVLKQEAEGRFAELQTLIGNAEVNLAELDYRLTAVERDLESSAESQSPVAHYLRDAWEQSKWYLLIVLVTFFVGPSIVKLLSFYLLAPILARGKAIKFSEEEGFLQSSDDSLKRKTRFIFDWSIPFTSIACRLTELVELRNGQAGGRLAATLSNGDDPRMELSVIEVPDGASIILRPSFLVGVLTKGEDKVEIRRRWTLFRWQAWITLQFRFFEFVGPCRIVVAGSRGVRAEILQDEGEGTRPARRTNQLSTIGFTPNLDYLPVRAETFWGYYRDMNPLFDDLFAGNGLFVLQETSRDSDQTGPKKFWATIWNSILKVFGI